MAGADSTCVKRNGGLHDCVSAGRQSMIGKSGHRFSERSCV